jgi:hypothetical protein
LIGPAAKITSAAGPSSVTPALPPETFERKRPRIEAREINLGGADRQGGGNIKDDNWGNSVRELTRAILKFGEAYEQAESTGPLATSVGHQPDL